MTSFDAVQCPSCQGSHLMLFAGPSWVDVLCHSDRVPVQSRLRGFWTLRKGSGGRFSVSPPTQKKKPSFSNRMIFIAKLTFPISTCCAKGLDFFFLRVSLWLILWAISINGGELICELLININIITFQFFLLLLYGNCIEIWNNTKYKVLYMRNNFLGSYKQSCINNTHGILCIHAIKQFYVLGNICISTLVFRTTLYTSFPDRKIYHECLTSGIKLQFDKLKS